MHVCKVIVSCLLYCLFAGSRITAHAQQQGRIYGQWHNIQFGYSIALILNSDGSGEFDGESIRFKDQGATLSIVVNGVSTDYSYTLYDNSLTLFGGDLDGHVKFSRYMTADNDHGPKKILPAFSGTSDALIGLWSGGGEMINFRADGTCVYLGNTFPYQISQGHVIISTNQGNNVFEYLIRGGQLTLTANGQRAVYNRPAGASTSTQNPKRPVAGGQIPIELVGKWCYLNMSTNSQSSRCIALNADGTYVYSSESSGNVDTNESHAEPSSQHTDHGTWYMEEDRLYYHSQKDGDGYYRLEKRNHPKNVNDPLIVLDGEPFVTTTRRAPWR